jgi:hypothetical protein
LQQKIIINENCLKFFIYCWNQHCIICSKVEYKNNIIAVDGNKIGKVEVQKQNFGLTKNFNLYSMGGEKLVIAVLSTEFEGDKNDNTTMFYRFTFLPTNQVEFLNYLHWEWKKVCKPNRKRWNC